MMLSTGSHGSSQTLSFESSSVLEVASVVGSFIPFQKSHCRILGRVHLAPVGDFFFLFLGSTFGSVTDIFILRS